MQHLDRETMELTIAIDIRTAYMDFLDEVIKLAESVNCDFFDFVVG